MANLKRNSIDLFKEMNGEEIVTEKFWTPPFLPMKVVYEAADLMGKYEKTGASAAELTSEEIRSYLEEMTEFVAKRVYDGQFTKEDLENKFHAPDAFAALQEQIYFVAWGLQTDETKKFLAKKKN